MEQENKSVCQRFLRQSPNKDFKTKTEEQLACLQFSQRETGYQHPYLRIRQRPYEKFAAGDERSVEILINQFNQQENHKLAQDSLVNFQFSFVEATLLTTLSAIKAGVEEQLAYTLHDYFLNQASHMTSVEAIKEQHTQMVKYFYDQLLQYKKNMHLPQDIQEIITQIDLQLHTKITVDTLATIVHRSPNYLSARFKKIMGETLSSYIQNRKIQVAQNMLRYSDYSYAEIANYLCFSSQSYFTQTFKKVTGQLPSQYRQEK